MTTRKLNCAFCRRPREEVRALVVAPYPLAGVPVAICWDCAASATEQMLGGPQSIENAKRSVPAERDA